MSLRMIIMLLSVLLLSACATDNPQQPYMGNQPSQDNMVGMDLYDANKNAQKPQSSNWGWTNNQY